MSNPRLARIEVGMDYLLEILSGHRMSKVVTDIPPGARVYTAEADQSRRAIYLTVESASFAEVPDHAHIPMFSPTVTVEVSEMAMLADLISRRHDFCRHCGEPLGDPQ